jgi:hypothetical protein
MNPYPTEILPQENHILITENLDNRYLIRHADTSDIKELWNNETNSINLTQFCNPTTRIEDLSTSLLGIFIEEHCGLVFHKGSTYYEYCKPDEKVDTPIYEMDYTYDGDKGYFYIKIDDISGISVNYKNPSSKTGDTYIGKCCVLHTPMKWNYWHFSIRWDINVDSDTGSSTISYENLSKGMKKQFGTIARSMVVDNTSINRPENINQIPFSLYKKDSKASN